MSSLAGRCLFGLFGLLGWCFWLGACTDFLGTPSEKLRDAAPDVTARDDGPSDTPIREVSPELPPAVKRVPYRDTWYGGAVMYQIFPRSFQDSDGDGIGDLKGIVQRLDYLRKANGTDGDLGIAGIWLTPIFRSGSYHGYDTIDYKAIDPAYGTMDDFRLLLKEAHKRDIKIILDLVLNHSSREHPWFKDASKGPDAEKRAWYVWRDKDPMWPHPFASGRSPWVRLGGFFYYAIFSPGMPDLNLAHPPVVEAIKDTMKYWLSLGVDGFRFDAVRYLLAPDASQQADAPATHALLRSMLGELRTSYPKALFVGEAWTTTQAVAQYFGNGDELDLCFQFDLVDAVDRAFQRGRASFVRTVLANAIKYLQDPAFHAPILGNHDHKRLMSRLLHQQSAAALAATLLLTLPGTPFIYYGEEIGMGNAQNEGDISKRAPMQWDRTTKAGFSKGIPWARLYGKQETASVSVQQATSGSLLRQYKTLIHLRRRHPALRHGVLRLLDLEGRDGTETTAGLAFVREDRKSGQRVLVVLNFSDASVLKAKLTKDAFGQKAPTHYRDLQASDAKRQSWTMELPDVPIHGALVLLLED